MKIWDQVEETDPKFTKPTFDGFTSVNGMYLYKKATEVFGAVGIGWGYQILEERYDDGLPFLIKDCGEVLEKTHTIKLELWFKQGEEIGKVVNFGHTKYIYKTKKGHMTDSEAPKKTLTDAIKKCLSMLGFASDIFMGEFENSEYVNELARKSELEHADDKDEVILKQKKEYRDWVNKELDCYRLIDDLSALKTVHTGHLRKANRRQDSESMEEFKAMYNSRINEINKIKDHLKEMKK
jgi:hypothetical protein